MLQGELIHPFVSGTQVAYGAPEFAATIRDVRPTSGLERSFLAFIAMWMFIGLVSAYDGYLTVRHQHLLHILEQNPVGRWIMDLDSGLEPNHEFEYVVANRQLANFLGLKFAGTVLGLGIMLAVHRYKASLGLTVTGVIAGLQGVLAVYLSCF